MHYVLHEHKVADIGAANLHVVVVGVLAAEYHHVGVVVPPHILHHAVVVEHHHVYLPPEYLLEVGQLAHRQEVAAAYHGLHAVAAHSHYAASGRYGRKVHVAHYVLVGKHHGARHGTGCHVDVVDWRAGILADLRRADFPVEVYGADRVLHLGIRQVVAGGEPLLRQPEVYHHAVNERVVDGELAVEVFREVRGIHVHPRGKLGAREPHLLDYILYSLYYSSIVGISVHGIVVFILTLAIYRFFGKTPTF